MRYRLMATYRGAPYEAGIGPANGHVVLFAACPPPEELGFEPATGHWRKELPIQDVQAVWESRPVGMFRGEHCIVLDDLGDRVHIGFLGHDGYRAEQLGYWQVDRGVFELVAARDEVTEIVEERTDYPGQPGAVSRPSHAATRPGGVSYAPPTLSDIPIMAEPSRAPAADGVALPPPASGPPLPLEAEAMRAASAASRRDQPDPLTGPRPLNDAGPLNGRSAGTGSGSLGGPGPLNERGPLASPDPLNGTTSRSGPGPLNARGPLASPDPLTGPTSRSGPGPLNGPGPLGGPISSSGPAPLNGPGPLDRPSPASGPGPASAPDPASRPADVSGQSPLSGPSSLSGPARGADRAAVRLTPPAGAALPNGPALLEPERPDPAAARNGTGAQASPATRTSLAPGTSDAASLLHAAPVTADLPAVSPDRDRLGPATPSYTPRPSISGGEDAAAKSAFRPGSAGSPLSPARDFAPARDFPAGTPIPPGAAIPQASPMSPGTGTVLADPAAPPISAARPIPAAPSTPAGIPRQAPPPARPLNTAAPTATPGPTRASGPNNPASATAESPRRRRSAKRRMATERIFGELASLAAIPASTYSVGEEVDGAMCLLETADGFEVFTSAGGSRHEVRVFSDEESACFYLFGVLAADAVRTGVLVPGQTARASVPAHPRDPLAGLGEPLLHR